ncbi:MAG: hypothetical protein JJE13_02380 [Thermoleophilia bacterium]|nr:hypothetical protein [Thermoleophilia bacterium]
MASSSEAAKRGVVVVRTVAVGSPGNASIGVVPFTDAIYDSCADAPTSKQGCQTVGGVDYKYGVGQLETTVSQWVKFLNTSDPNGRNRDRLYEKTQSSTKWPEYGQVNKRSNAKPGRHYYVASKAWADKPYGFATFLSAARFVNSLDNGKVLSKQKSARKGFKYVTYKVRLSPKTGRGMYNLKNRNATRAHKRGFVVPSQDEWIKAAYFDPSDGTYWKYPTNAGVYGDGTATEPNPTQLDFSTGNVTNGADQPLAGFKESDVLVPSWCPSVAQVSGGCSTTNPFGLSATTYAKAFVGGLGTVGQARTTSPWGTLDQGGNAVEWTDTITPPPSGRGGGRVWRRLHGGIANSTAYQMWPSAVGLQPQDNFFYARTYPWLGIRVGVIGGL